MKKQHRRMTLVIATLVISVFIMASSSFAEPNFGANCGDTGCHTNAGTTLSVNATGTVQATRGVSFLLVIDAGDGTGAISMQDGDADNGEFTISDDVVEDGDPEDTNGNTGEIQASITFTPNTAGSYVIRIWTGSAGRIGTSVSVNVDVAEPTGPTTSTTPPTSTPPTTTPTGPTTLTPEELMAIWELMMYIITPASAVILALLGWFVLRRARN
ncbi:MAG: hypothetical protein ACXABV_02765 [Candidatus Thorarchaeota archaeon]|jgi:hypothetical protein